MNSVQLLTVVVVVLVVALIGLLILTFKFYQQSGRLIATNRQLESHMNERVQIVFEDWRNKECEGIRMRERDMAGREANTNLEKWKIEYEVMIRSDAAKKSQSVTIGKITEHLVPYFPGFGFNPKDVRFIGSPIDLIIFDGMNNDDVQEVVFVEVKTGEFASLTKRERQIRDAILARRVRWIEHRIDRTAN